MASPKPTVVDLFAGAGGLSLAAREAGFRVLAAVEMSPHACDTYEENFIRNKHWENRPNLYREDITQADLPARLMNDLYLQPGSLDVLMGGPPCQGFSTHRIKGAGVGDKRNELLLRYFDFVKLLKPKAFLVENVPGLLWPRHAEYLATFQNLARRHGYRLLGPEPLNARDYGVPQNRKRIFMVGIRSDIAVEFSWPEPTHGDPAKREEWSPGCKPWRCAGEVFEKPLPENDPNSVHMNHCQELVDAFRSTPKNGGSREQSNRVLPCHQNGYKGHKDVYGRIDPSKPGPTMTTACVNPSKGRFVHPTEDHGITARHAARFQTFPDSFVFGGGLMAAAVQIGNAVPVKLGEVLLTELMVVLEFSRHA